MNSPQPVTLVTVNYHGTSDTRRLLASLARLEELQRLRLVIVNNCADPVSRREIDALIADAPLHSSALHVTDNLYYWGGVAYGLAWALRDGLSTWSILCNNDLEIRNTDFLVRLASRDPDLYPLVAPSITSADTKGEQNPLAKARWGRIGLLKWRVFDGSVVGARLMVGAHRLRRLVRGFARSWNGATVVPVEQTIYAPHGAMVILSRAFFEAGGFLDTSVPMFAEELSLAETARLLGLDVTFCPDLRVVHYEHGALGTALTREKYQWARQAHEYLRGAYFSETPEDLDVIRARCHPRLASGAAVSEPSR